MSHKVGKSDKSIQVLIIDQRLSNKVSFLTIPLSQFINIDLLLELAPVALVSTLDETVTNSFLYKKILL